MFGHEQTFYKTVPDNSMQLLFCQLQNLEKKLSNQVQTDTNLNLQFLQGNVTTICNDFIAFNTDGSNSLKTTLLYVLIINGNYKVAHQLLGHRSFKKENDPLNARLFFYGLLKHFITLWFSDTKIELDFLFKLMEDNQSFDRDNLDELQYWATMFSAAITSIHPQPIRTSYDFLNLLFILSLHDFSLKSLKNELHQSLKRFQSDQRMVLWENAEETAMDIPKMKLFNFIKNLEQLIIITNNYKQSALGHVEIRLPFVSSEVSLVATGNCSL